MNIILLLAQKETWVDRRGRSHVIADMDPDYAANIARFLERRAGSVVVPYARAVMLLPMPDEATEAYDIVTADWEREMDAMFADPVAWLGKRPLMVALRERAGQQNVNTSPCYACADLVVNPDTCPCNGSAPLSDW